jgi:hypothetical protein
MDKTSHQKVPKTTTETLVDHQLEMIPTWNILFQENKFLKSILSQKLQKKLYNNAIKPKLFQNSREK